MILSFRNVRSSLLRLVIPSGDLWNTEAAKVFERSGPDNEKPGMLSDVSRIPGQITLQLNGNYLSSRISGVS